MKCPVCYANHRKYPRKCLSGIENDYGHLTILFHGYGDISSREGMESVVKANHKVYKTDINWAFCVIERYWQIQEYKKIFEEGKHGHKDHT